MTRPVDPHNTVRCPIDDRCEKCGATDRTTDRYTAATPGGVLCVELCEDCAAAGKLPSRSALPAALAAHCTHLGVDLDQMAAIVGRRNKRGRMLMTSTDPLPHHPDATTGEFPYRMVDQLNHGWLSRGAGQYDGFDPSQSREHSALTQRSLADIEREFGVCRPVQPMTAAEGAELAAAFDLAGRKTIPSLASALEVVFHEARERSGVNVPDDYGYAVRTLTAGRPGSWEAAALIEVVLFGNELNLHPYTSSLSVQAMRATGPNTRRVHVPARDRIAAVLRGWTDSPDHYTEVPETLAAVLTSYADDQYGETGWAQIADQWLQPGGMATHNFYACYHLLYSTSAYFNPGLLT